MTHKKGSTVKEQVQSTLLNEQAFLTGIVHGCLQELIAVDFQVSDMWSPMTTGRLLRLWPETFRALHGSVVRFTFRNIIVKLSRRDLNIYLPLIKDIFTPSDYQEALRRKHLLIDRLEGKYQRVADWVDENIESCFSVFHLPPEHRRKSSRPICWNG